MRRDAWIAAGAAAAAAVGWALWPREAPQRSGESAVSGPEGVGAAGERSPDVRGTGRAPGPASGALQDSFAPSGAPGSTPALQQAATEQDGFVEARVLAQGKPLAGAKVRLYLRGRADRSTAQVDWRF